MKDNSFYKSLIENDLNPFILFDNSGKIKDFNKEAEFLFNTVNPKDLYELAVANASLSFGFNHKFISLKYGKFRFYAILVGYITDDEIALRMYKEVSIKNDIKKIENVESVNIFSLIAISQNTTLFQNDINVEEIYDVSMPQIKMNINQFLLVLNECFTIIKDEKSLKLKVYIKTGEYELINNTKYKVAAIEFVATKHYIINDDLVHKALLANMNIFVDLNSIKLEFPMIL
jgi:nitrogen-specific signal transduction histidine kinase